MLRPAPSEWNFFGRPSPDQYALIFQSIYKYGLWHPITVWEQEDGHYMILGGHTRDLVYDELYQMTGDESYLKIPCKVYQHTQMVRVQQIIPAQVQQHLMLQVQHHLVMQQVQQIII